MRGVSKWFGLVAVGMLWAVQVHAQTADDVVEKHLAAMGGRGALAKLDSRIATGSITASLQGTDITGPVEIHYKAPNKARTYFKLDLSQFGAGELVFDQRCDGKAGFVSNSLQGDREITGNQLQGMLNARFPTPLAGYKEAGASIELAGKEKVGTREAFVLQYAPKAGPASRQYFDAETFLLLRVVAKVEAQGAGEIEQTTEVSDYREIDGVKVPFAITIVNPQQTLAITLSKVEHNKPIEDSIFSKPVAR